MFSKDLVIRPFTNCISTIYLILRTFHSLKRGEDGSRKSEKDMMRKAFFAIFLVYL